MAQREAMRIAAEAAQPITGRGIGYKLFTLRQLRKLMDGSVSLERACNEMLKSRSQGRAAASTVEALMYGLRDGIHTLPTNPERLRRLSELSADQLKEVCARLQNFKSTIARPWTADEVAALVRIWGKSHA